MNWLLYSPFFALLCGTISLWIPKKISIAPWNLFLFFALVLGILSGAANFIGIISVIGFYFFVNRYATSSSFFKYSVLS
jgi:hypothetical protein